MTAAAAVVPEDWQDQLLIFHVHPLEPSAALRSLEPPFGREPRLGSAEPEPALAIVSSCAVPNKDI